MSGKYYNDWIGYYEICFPDWGVTKVKVIDWLAPGVYQWGCVNITFNAYRDLPYYPNITLLPDTEVAEIGIFASGDLHISDEYSDRTEVLREESVRKEISEENPIVLYGDILLEGDLKVGNILFEDMVWKWIGCKIEIVEAYEGWFEPLNAGQSYNKRAIVKVYIDSDELVNLIPESLGTGWEVDYNSISTEYKRYPRDKNLTTFGIKINVPKNLKDYKNNNLLLL